MRMLASQRVWAALLLPVATGIVEAAPAPAVDEKAEAQARLDAVLQQWAKASDALQEAHFTIKVTDHDSVTGEQRKSSLEVFVKKPDLMRIDCKKADGSLESSFIYVNGTVHDISIARKTDRWGSLSDDFGFPEKPDRYPDGFCAIWGAILERHCWLAFGPPVRDLKSRFDLNPTKEDDYWIYLELKPRKQRDRPGITRMQLVLNRQSFRLRRLWIEQPNSEEMTYDFEPPRGGSEEAVTADSIMKGLPEDCEKIDCSHAFIKDYDWNKTVIELLNKQEGKPTKP